MSKNKKICTEDVREYIVSQIQAIKECADKFGLKFFVSYLDLSVQVLDEELIISDENKKGSVL